MRAFLVILRLLGYALALALLAYFVVRELKDPWLLDQIGDRTSETVAASPEPAPAPVEVVAAESEPEPEPEPMETVVEEIFPAEFDAEAAQASLEDELLRTQAALAEALERKLMQNMEHIQGAYEDRGRMMETVQETVASLVNDLEREGAETATEAAAAIGEIEASLNALTESSAALDRSLEQWAAAYQSIAEIEKISSHMLDERNYEFVDYTVGSAETLAGIATKLEGEYAIEDVDLGTLIPMFNEIQTRQRSLGVRRGSMRVVANETLRIPLPKTSGELLQDQQIGTRMEAQRATILGAQRRQANVQATLGAQTARLRQTVQRITGLRELTHLMGVSLEELDTSQTLDTIGPQATPEQRQAWDAFNAAYRDFRQASDVELQRASKATLELATRQLLDAYVGSGADPETGTDYLLDDPDRKEKDDLEWLKRFIERYEPQ